MLFDGWDDLLRIAVVGVATYAALVALLRLTGKRTLGQLNAFDFVVTVALGSVLASTLLTADVSLSEGMLALAVLIGLQAIIAWTCSRRPRVRDAITSSPALLLLDGQVCSENLSKNRMGMGELRQAVRQGGHGDVTAVGAVVLETDGTLSVIARDSMGDRSALEDLPTLDRSGD